MNNNYPPYDPHSSPAQPQPAGTWQSREPFAPPPPAPGPGYPGSPDQQGYPVQTGYPVQPGYPAVSPGYAPAYAMPRPKDPRRVGAARAVNRMSLVTLFQFLAAIALETPLIWLTAALGVSIYGDSTAFTLLEGAMVPLSTALPFLLYLLFGRDSAGESLRFERVGFVNALLCVLVGLGVCMLANYPAIFIQDLLGNVGYTPADTSIGNSTTLAGFALEMAVTAVLVPVMEEFAFRGVLLSHLRRYGKGFAIFASALIFALVHLDFSNVLFAFVAGLVFGFLYVRTGNLWVSICIHALNNAIAVFGSSLELFFDDAAAELVDQGLMAVPIAVGAAALLLLLIFKRRFLFTRSAPREGDLPPLGRGESVAAVAKAPIFWVLVAISLFYTLNLIL